MTAREGARGAPRAAPAAPPPARPRGAARRRGPRGVAAGRAARAPRGPAAGSLASCEGTHRPQEASPGEKLSRGRDATAAEGLRCPAPQPGASRGRRAAPRRPAAFGALPPLQKGSTFPFPTATVGGRAGQVRYRLWVITCIEGKPQTKYAFAACRKADCWGHWVFLLYNIHASLHAVSFHARILRLDVTNSNLFLYELFQGLSASLITNRQKKVFVCLKSNNVFKRKKPHLYIKTNKPTRNACLISKW